LVSKWDIYLCDLNPTKGSEQQGTRPVLVVSNDAVNHHLPVSTVLPLSSVKENDKIYPTEILLPAEATRLPKLSVAMVQQIRTVSHKRLIKKAGSIESDDIKNRILTALRDYFEY
jgi:mRNA interferase MazF